MRDALRGAVVAGAVLAPSPLLAQAAAGIKTAPPSVWHFGLSATGDWYENAYFTSLADTQWSTTGQATLSHERRFRTGTFSLSGFGGAIYYPQVNDFNQPIYGGSLGLTWSTSQRTKLNLGQSFQRTSTRYLNPVAVEGLPLPTTSVDNATSTLGLVHHLSSRWQLGLDGSFIYYHYDNAQLVGGQELTAQAQLSHHVGPNGSFYAGYGFTSSWIQGRTQRAHEALLGGRKRPERGVGFELAGGAGYVESTGAFYPSGRAGLSATGRHSSLELLYYRDFGQAFGYGRQMIGDIASATLGWTPARRLSFNAGYNFGYRRDPADESYTVVSSIASAGFNWTLGGGVGFAARYGWERNETKGQPVIEGGRASATLSYGVDWR